MRYCPAKLGTSSSPDASHVAAGAGVMQHSTTGAWAAYVVGTGAAQLARDVGNVLHTDAAITASTGTTKLVASSGKKYFTTGADSTITLSALRNAATNCECCGRVSQRARPRLSTAVGNVRNCIPVQVNSFDCQPKCLVDANDGPCHSIVTWTCNSGLLHLVSFL